MKSATSNSPLFRCILCYTLHVDLSVIYNQGHALIHGNIGLEFVVFLVLKVRDF